MQSALLDTDTLSEVIKGRHLQIIEHAKSYLAANGHFTISLVTRYEILRGLKAKGAETQIARFDVQCHRSRVLPISDEIVVRAAELYAQMRAKGRQVSDADLLVAATALTHQLVRVTNNLNHFRPIDGLMVESWAT